MVKDKAKSDWWEQELARAKKEVDNAIMPVRSKK